MQPPVIDDFSGEYEFLSNFYTSELIPPTVEHWYQAFKVDNKHPDCTKWVEKILLAKTPGRAKKFGQECPLRQNWEEKKDQIMLELVRRKFLQNDLKEQLLSTGDALLIEGNTWHDQYWGDCICPKHKNKPGKNMLGVILMNVRKEIQDGN